MVWRKLSGTLEESEHRVCHLDNTANLAKCTFSSDLFPLCVSAEKEGTNRNQVMSLHLFLKTRESG